MLTKLLNVQAKLKAPKSQFNSFAKFNYRSCEDILEAVKPLLKEEGLLLVVSDELVQIGDRYYIKTTAKVTDGSESEEAVAFAREPEMKKGNDEPQITGTASSYARKYALNGLFLIDDTKDPDTDEYAKQTKKAETKAEKTSSYNLSFQEVREKLGELTTVEELNNYWKELGLSEKQANILKGDFAARKKALEVA